MRRLILAIVMLFVAGAAWAGTATTITCDECGKEIRTSPCYPQDYHVRVTYDPSPMHDCNVIYAVYVPPPPADMIFCGSACMKAHYCKDEDDGVVPEQIGEYGETQIDLTLPYYDHDGRIRDALIKDGVIDKEPSDNNVRNKDGEIIGYWAD